MLAADQQQLKDTLRLNALAIREKEMKLFGANFVSIGTQAALLAGFAMTALAELSVPDDTPKIFKLLFFVSITITLAAELHCVCNTTLVNLYGPALALRSNDSNALERAAVGMYEERRQIFITYWIGVIFFQVAAMAAVWIVVPDMPNVAMGCTLMIVGSLIAVTRYGYRIYHRFGLEDGEEITYDDLAPATSQMTSPSRGMTRRSQSSPLLRDGFEDDDEFI